MQKPATKTDNISYDDFKNQVLKDYKTAVVSRECSLLGRREVLTGKAKFGIFGDGKEVPQIAMAKVFKNGDFRSGYYRDQTFFMALGLLSAKEFFAGLYANTDIEKEPMSAGRQMGGHFSTPSLNEDGSWKNLMQQKNSSADISPTAGQMSRLLGLAQASQVYREINDFSGAEKFSKNGNEIAWGTIGDSSTSEGVFWETINAAGVMQVPMVVSVWDDGYGISVPKKYQTTKESISEVLKGFQRDSAHEGIEIITVKGWDYPALIETYEKVSTLVREEHVPVLIHVEELTQPQGHSTSGSHERYKSKERLEWEKEKDCIVKMGEWMVEQEIATSEDLAEIDKAAKKEAREAMRAAWKDFNEKQNKDQKELLSILGRVQKSSPNGTAILAIRKELNALKNPAKFQLLQSARKALRKDIKTQSESKKELQDWIKNYINLNQPDYSSHLYSSSAWNARAIEEVLPVYDQDAKEVDGRIIIRDNFDKIFETKPEVLIFGEDSGNIGDVNQGLEGLQKKYGKMRVSDTGIRENTIAGQGIGMALRGLRPIAEIQYLDYILYCLQVLSDDLATTHYRTKGRQKAPVIIRTRGHRLEGIWHSGSPMAGLIHLLRGINILVPRNMQKAAGFYNTMLASDEPAVIVESLNGYRRKEKLPVNLGEFKTPVGKVEVVREGSDITLVSYGSTFRIVLEAAEDLAEVGIDAEVIDIQSLIPFDLDHDIAESLKKTSRLLIIDEDVPGGASSYIMHQVLETQNAYKLLDSKPESLTAKEHRPAFSTDGDYFSKPSKDDVFEKTYAIMNEVNPKKYPPLY
ncbi:MAG TPA: thiamine pyrophosphate-dependent enzyme [Flavobacteriaceae bacterium]|nr:thiamine pyrophosphate-dependent enzyme [Flavobacteriaceae bacterium]